MSIRIKIRKNTYWYMDIGFKGKKFSQMWLITVGKEFLDDSGRLVHATIDWSFFRHPKFWS